MKPLLLLVSLSLVACQQTTTRTTDATRPVKVVVAQDAQFIAKDFAAMATPDRAVTMAFKISGQVADVVVSSGESVAKGQLLATLNPRDVELQLAAEKSAFEQARSQLNRASRLVERQAISQQEYEISQTRYTQARSAYENGKDLLIETKLYAPFESYVEKTFVDPYQRISSGEPILRLVDPSTTTVEFTIPERNLPLLGEEATKFTVQFDNFPDKKFEAVLTNYVRTSTNATGYPVSLTLEHIDRERYPISPGMSCTVEMLSRDPFHEGVWLPLSAIYAPTTGGEWVWVVDDEQRVELHKVVLGELYDQNRVIVKSGVDVGARVVSSGLYQLREGEVVKVLTSKAG